MSESQPGELSQVPATAGALLRQARVAKGLHIAALATSIKVAPRKLELLEGDRFDELPGATFTRALAQTVCRTLKIDPAPVLALLPAAQGHGLPEINRGLNAPFRDKPAGSLPSDSSLLGSRVVRGAAALLVVGVLIYLMPSGWIGSLMSRSVVSTDQGGDTSTPVPEPQLVPSESIDSAAVPTNPVPPSAPAALQAPSLQPSPVFASAPVTASMPTSAAAATLPSSQSAAVGTTAQTQAASMLLVRTNAESWIEVIDARGTSLLSRRMQAGEAVGVDGALPLRVKIGNASATQVSFKGQAVDLVASRSNVARLELK